MSTAPLPISFEGESTWDVARLLPPQGRCSEAEYLSATDATNQLVEFANGRVELPAMPTKSHQKMARFLCNLFLAFMEPRQLGDAITAPYRVRLPDGTFREPDVVVYLQEHLGHFGERFGEGADLVVEIVSDGKENRERDLKIKPAEYAKAGIQEYWIVDPQDEAILVLSLQEGAYRRHGSFQVGDEATSALLPGFSVAVNEVLGAGRPVQN